MLLLNVLAGMLPLSCTDCGPAEAVPRLQPPCCSPPVPRLQARLAGATNLTEAVHAAEALDRAGGGDDSVSMILG